MTSAAGPSMKVFGLGLSRTGTTSMHEAMGILGLHSAPDSVALLDHIDVAFLDAHDAFFDNPIPFRFNELDRACVARGWDAKWIVTHRNRDAWLTSMQWLFDEGLARLDRRTRRIADRVHRKLYGTTDFDPAVLGAIHDGHHAQLTEFVVGRDALWIDLGETPAWEPLCELLNRPVPIAPFPHRNRSSAG